MENILKDINAINGVTGCFVCDWEGRVLGRSLPGVFDGAMLALAGRTLAQTIKGLETARRRRINELDLIYRDGRLVTKNLSGLGVLGILCVRNINVPLLNLTANLAARKIAEMLKTQQAGAVPSAPARPPAGIEVPSAEVLQIPTAAAVEVPPAKVVEGPPEEVPWEETVGFRALLLQEAQQVLSRAQQEGIVLRVMGGPAVWMRCPRAAHLTIPPETRDLDLVGYNHQNKRVHNLFQGLGYQPNKRFNAMAGTRADFRERFTHPQKQILIDVFHDSFSMCHRLSLVGRLELDRLTIPLADLLLTKLQVVEMNEKELREVFALLCDHELGDKADPEQIDGGYITRVCSDDWGWYRTVTLNIERCISFANDFLSPDEHRTFLPRILHLYQLIEAAPKSMRWQLRARIGEATRWYQVPEEI
ncbi:MAG: hypothetical protein HYZ68_01210 [Chloroflexi bacterium]|nr:hypothetical protein [Chloroflexota bacterium]